MKKISRNENSIIFHNDFQDFNTGNLLSPIETEHYTIIQVADSYYKNRFVIEEHKQFCDLEITFPLLNGLLCANNGQWQKLNKYDAHFVYQGERHVLKGSRGCRFQTLAINVKGDARELLEAIKARFNKNRLANIPDVAELLSSIVFDFATEKKPFYEIYVDSLITSTLVKLLRSSDNADEEELISTADILPAVLNYIDSNFLEIYSLEELSSRFGYNYSHICKSFKKHYSITPGEYLLSKKMEYASALLKKDKSVKFISEQLGYSTPYNFSRAFKTHFGSSPKHYKLLK